MTDRRRSIEAEDLERLPIFPLRTAVLLPHVLLPLHIFEQRYREMTERALADDRPIAIAKIRENEPKDKDKPAVEQIVGAGRIIKYEELDDGRYNILLAGISRVRVEQEFPQEALFREVRVTELQSEIRDRAELRKTVRLMRELIFTLRQWKPAISSVMMRLLSDDLPMSALLDRLTGTLVLSALEQQALLEELVVEKRAEFLLDKISELVADCQSGGGEDGSMLN
jgi:Lon protease-like protein